MVLPGGFSYGDYLRCGAISRFAPVMTEVVAAAGRGHAGARHLQRLPDPLRVAPAAGCADPQRPPQVRLPRPAAAHREHRTPWTSSYDEGAEVTIVLKNGEGGFVADDATLDRLEGEGRVVARYLDDNPNGSLRDIAGITNERGNVVGLMPHPEHAVEDLTGAGTDGLGFFTRPRRAGPLAEPAGPRHRAVVERCPGCSARPGRRCSTIPGDLQRRPALPGHAAPASVGAVEDPGDGRGRVPVRRRRSGRAGARRTSGPAEPNFSTGCWPRASSVIQAVARTTLPDRAGRARCLPRVHGRGGAWRSRRR